MDVREGLEILRMLRDNAQNMGKYLLSTNDNSLAEKIEESLPLKNLEEVFRLEQTLKDNNYKKSYMSYLTKIGGTTVDNNVQRILVKMFTNEVAQLFSWEGKSGKQRLDQLTLIKVISLKVFSGKTVLLPNGQTKHQCPQCQRLYSHWHSMTRHLRLECGVPPQFHCLYCDFQSTRKGSINAHIAIKHTEEAREKLRYQSRYQCSHCQKMFTHKVAMSKHSSECTLQALVCSKCSFVAQHSADLEKHICTKDVKL